MTRPPHHARRQLLLQTWQRVGVPLRNLGSVFARSKQRARSRLPSLADLRRKLRPQKRTPSNLRTWGSEVCCLNQASSAGRRVSGDGVPPSSACDERHYYRQLRHWNVAPLKRVRGAWGPVPAGPPHLRPHPQSPGIFVTGASSGACRRVFRLRPVGRTGRPFTPATPGMNAQEVQR